MKVLFETVETAQRMAELYLGESDGFNCVDFPSYSLPRLIEFIEETEIEAYPIGSFCLYLSMENKIVGVPLTSKQVWRRLSHKLDFMRYEILWPTDNPKKLIPINTEVSPTFFSDSAEQLVKALKVFASNP